MLPCLFIRPTNITTSNIINRIGCEFKRVSKFLNAVLRKRKCGIVVISLSHSLDDNIQNLKTPKHSNTINISTIPNTYTYMYI